MFQCNDDDHQSANICEPQVTAKTACALFKDMSGDGRTVLLGLSMPFGLPPDNPELPGTQTSADCDSSLLLEDSCEQKLKRQCTRVAPLSGKYSLYR